MASFGAYNTSDTTTGNTPLANGASVILGPLQTGTAQSIGGSIFTDQSGTLYVEQSFDGINWDISNATPITISVPGTGQGQGFTQSIIAPNVRIRYVNGSTTQGVIRLFTRTFATGR